jgi:hypothetical protein
MIDSCNENERKDCKNKTEIDEFMASN